MRKAVFVCMTIGLVLAGAWAAAAINSDAGTSTGSFLQMGGGARSLAMGGTSADLVGDSSAIWANPGLLAGMSAPEISFTHGQYVEDVALNQAVFAAPMSIGVVGLALTMVEMGSMEGFTAMGDPTGTWEPKDTAITGVYSVEAGKAGL